MEKNAGLSSYAGPSYAGRSFRGKNVAKVRGCVSRGATTLDTLLTPCTLRRAGARKTHRGRRVVAAGRYTEHAPIPGRYKTRKKHLTELEEREAVNSAL